MQLLSAKCDSSYLCSKIDGNLLVGLGQGVCFTRRAPLLASVSLASAASSPWLSALVLLELFSAPVDLYC